jgi:hypothetical protein
MVEHVVTTQSSKKIKPLIEAIFESMSWIPKSPPMVMRLRAKTEVEKQKLNYILRTLIADGFDVKVFKSVYANEYMATLDLKSEYLEQEA